MSQFQRSRKGYNFQYGRNKHEIGTHHASFMIREDGGNDNTYHPVFFNYPTRIDELFTGNQIKLNLVIPVGEGCPLRNPVIITKSAFNCIVFCVAKKFIVKGKVEMTDPDNPDDPTKTVKGEVVKTFNIVGLVHSEDNSFRNPENLKERLDTSLELPVIERSMDQMIGEFRDKCFLYLIDNLERIVCIETECEVDKLQIKAIQGKIDEKTKRYNYYKKKDYFTNIMKDSNGIFEGVGVDVLVSIEKGESGEDVVRYDFEVQEIKHMEGRMRYWGKMPNIDLIIQQRILNQRVKTLEDRLKKIEDSIRGASTSNDIQFSSWPTFDTTGMEQTDRNLSLEPFEEDKEEPFEQEEEEEHPRVEEVSPTGETVEKEVSDGRRLKKRPKKTSHPETKKKTVKVSGRIDGRWLLKKTSHPETKKKTVFFVKNGFKKIFLSKSKKRE